MLDSIYEWIRNLACYLVIVTVVLEVIPGSGYKKYIRFFTGLVMILLLMTPVLRMTGINKDFTVLYHKYEYEQVERELEEQKIHLQEADLFDFLPEEYPWAEFPAKDKRQEDHNLSDDNVADDVKVEEIKIGE